MAICADDDVVMHGYAKLAARLCNIARQLNIGPAGGWITRGVIMHQDECGRPQIHRPADDFAHMDYGLINGAFGHQLIPDEHIARIEMQHTYPLHGERC